jgi:ABC-2 type transport system permease protein
VLVEPALFAAEPRVFRWLPGIASLSLRRQPAENLLPPTAAAVPLVVLAAVLVAGIRMVERDDVTG